MDERCVLFPRYLRPEESICDIGDDRIEVLSLFESLQSTHKICERSYLALLDSYVENGGNETISFER